MVHKLVALQARWVGRVDELLAAGLPDWRASCLPGRARSTMGRPDVRALFTGDELRGLDALVADLPLRLAGLDACGLPGTLVHGDFHPGNWRFGENGLVLLDWGDSIVGHPLLDFATFLPRVAEDLRGAVREAWLEAWQAVLPDADPARAAAFIGPIVAVRLAVGYQRFLDAIEPSERRYHEDDVSLWFRRALAAAQEVPGPVT